MAAATRARLKPLRCKPVSGLDYLGLPHFAFRRLQVKTLESLDSEGYTLFGSTKNYSDLSELPIHICAEACEAPVGVRLEGIEAPVGVRLEHLETPVRVRL